MIGMLTGILAHRQDPSLILDVGGVGYKVFVPVSLLSHTKPGEKMTLFTHTHVREDMLELYGFSEIEDLRLFEYLIGVSGVGCKTALGVFAVGTRSEVIQAIVGGDTTFFTAVPRLGKKNAQKLIIELKGKLGGVGDLDLSGQGSEQDEVVQALAAFGFSSQEALQALRKSGGAGKTVEEKITLALKELGR